MCGAPADLNPTSTPTASPQGHTGLCPTRCSCSCAAERSPWQGAAWTQVRAAHTHRDAAHRPSAAAGKAAAGAQWVRSRPRLEGHPAAGGCGCGCRWWCAHLPACPCRREEACCGWWRPIPFAASPSQVCAGRACSSRGQEPRACTTPLPMPSKSARPSPSQCMAETAAKSCRHRKPTSHRLQLCTPLLLDGQWFWLLQHSRAGPSRT